MASALDASTSSSLELLGALDSGSITSTLPARAIKSILLAKACKAAAAAMDVKPSVLRAAVSRS